MHRTLATPRLGGWGLQVLSVILKSSHFKPTEAAWALNSGTYSSGSVEDL